MGLFRRVLRNPSITTIAGFCFSAALVRGSTVCDLVASTTDIDVEQRLTIKYDEEQANYWSTACQYLPSACIIFPRSAAEVASIVTVLRNTTESFATKSGGHNPNLYFASVDGGPIISTANLNQVTLDAAAETVVVGPGNRWEEVQSSLEGSGFTVVGGRVGDVGVGGYLLGAGMSFKSTEYGWATDSVLAFELVLANSSVITVTNTSNPGLFKSLRGGGNAFGIVTAFTLRVYPQGLIWGGSVAYLGDNETSEALLSAVNDFMLDYPDPKAAIIATSELTLDGALPLWLMYLYYNGPSQPEGVFDAFLSIPHLVNTCQTQNYSSLLTANNNGLTKTNVIELGTETAPLPTGAVDGAGTRTEVSQAMLRNYFLWWKEVTNTEVWAAGGVLSEISFQPVPHTLAAIAKQQGGDLLDLDDSVDRLMFEFTFGYLGTSDTDSMVDNMNQMHDGIRELVLNYTAQGWLPEAYLPIFYNSGFYTQDFAGRLKPESLELAQSVREEVDPTGLFLNRTGGFKF